MPEMSLAFKEFQIQLGRQILWYGKKETHKVNGQVRTKDAVQRGLWTGRAGNASCLEGLDGMGRGDE